MVGFIPMRVLYYCPEYYSQHGGRTHARGFFNALGDLPMVGPVFLYPDHNPQITSKNNQKKISISGRLLGLLPLSFERAFRYFRPKRSLTDTLIDRLKLNSCDALIIRTGLGLPDIGRIKAACPGASVCLEINAAFFDESVNKLPFRSLFQQLEVNRYKQADACVVVSSYLKKYLENRGVPAKKILVNHNGVDLEIFTPSAIADIRAEYDIPKDAFLLGYVGGMEPFRRLPEVIRYISELRKAGNTDIYFMLIGDGQDMPEIQREIEACGDSLKFAVKCVGWVPHSEISTYLSAFDLAVFPFTNDYCSPLKLFEYLGAGLSAVGPKTSAVTEVFEDGVHLKMVEQDGSDFKRIVLELKGNENLRKQLARNGQQLVLENYTWKKNAERVLGHVEFLRYEQ